LHRVHGCGAAGGDIAGGQGDQDEHDGGGGVGEGVCSFDAVDVVGHDAAEGEGGCKPDDDAYESDFQAFAQNLTKESEAIGAEGHADCEFMGAAADCVGHDSEDANCGEKQSEGREDPHEGHWESQRTVGASDLFRQKHWIVDRLFIVDGKNSFADRWHNGERSDSGSDVEEGEGDGVLFERDIDVGARFPQIVSSAVFDDAYDFQRMIDALVLA